MLAASSAKTPDALFASLNASGLPDTPDAHQFINEVFQRAPRKHKHKKDSERKQAEAEAKALRAQRFDYLIEDDAGQSGVVEVKNKPKEKEKEKGKHEKHERHTRKRESNAREWEDDEEEDEGEEGVGEYV